MDYKDWRIKEKAHLEHTSYHTSHQPLGKKGYVLVSFKSKSLQKSSLKILHEESTPNQYSKTSSCSETAHTHSPHSKNVLYEKCQF